MKKTFRIRKEKRQYVLTIQPNDIVLAYASSLVSAEKCKTIAEYSYTLGQYDEFEATRLRAQKLLDHYGI